MQSRLGFTPRYVVGNHGAEDGAATTGTAAGAAATVRAHAARLDALRARLAGQAAALAAAGVTVEDKGPSIALHYRMARDRARAAACIDALLALPDAALRVFGGKLVVNVMPADAPDKAAALQALVARAGCEAAFFAGDDVNDEPVFAAAPAHWLTVRVGRDEPRSQARWFLDGTAEMAVLLDRMQQVLAAAPPA